MRQTAMSRVSTQFGVDRIPCTMNWGVTAHVQSSFLKVTRKCIFVNVWEIHGNVGVKYVNSSTGFTEHGQDLLVLILVQKATLSWVGGTDTVQGWGEGVEGGWVGGGHGFMIYLGWTLALGLLLASLCLSNSVFFSFTHSLSLRLASPPLSPLSPCHLHALSLSISLPPLLASLSLSFLSFLSIPRPLHLVKCKSPMGSELELCGSGPSSM